MGIEDILFPKKCYGCGGRGDYLCMECVKKLKKPDDICPECEKLSIGGWVHGRCRRSYGLDRLISVFEYKGIIQKMLKDVKFRSSWEVMEELSKAMVHELSGIDLVKKDFRVISVPMWEAKERKRGFNQAEILGKKLANELNVKYEDLLVRNRETKSQYGLEKIERRRNIKGSISLKKNPNNHKYLIVDDVWTTGSTIKECAKVLKKRGVKEVWGVVLSR